MVGAVAGSDDDLSGLPPSQLIIIERGAVVAGLAGGIVGFGVTGLLLLDVAAQATWVDRLLWLGPLLGWVIAWLPALRRQRSVIQVLALLSLLAGPLLASAWVTGGEAWIPVTSVAFAVVVVAAFALPMRAAIAAVVVTGVLDAWLTIQHPASAVVIEPAFAAGLAGAILNLVCGGLLIVARERWIAVAREMDADFALLAQVQDLNQREEHLLQVRAAVDRRIHETVLNTLTALSTDLPVGDPASVQAACSRDLAELNAGMRPWESAQASHLVAEAVRTVNASRTDAQPELACEIRCDQDPVLAPGAAEIVRDALVEAMRNVLRHAGVQHARVRVQETIDAATQAPIVLISVSDEGVGFTSTAAERFGLARGIRGGVVSAGGSAWVESVPGVGTTVWLSIPLAAMDRVVLPDITVDGAIERSLAGRIALMCAPVVAAILAIPMGADVGWSHALPWLMVTVLPVNLALAWCWNSRARVPIALLALALVALTMIQARALALDLGASACTSAPGLVWLQSTVVGGGLLLVVLAFRRAVVRLAVVVYGITLGTLLPLSLPVTCSDDALVPLLASSLYLILIVTVVEWGQRRFVAGMRTAQAVRARLQSQRLAMDAQAARVAGWSRLNRAITPLLSGVAAGELRIEDPMVRASARHEAAALRAVLGREPAHRGPTTHLIASMMEVAMHVDCTIDAEALSATVRQDLLPVPVQDFVMSLVAASPGATVQLRVLVDSEQEEYLLSVPATATAANRVAGVDGAAWATTDCTVEVFEGPDGTDRVSIRRPLHATGSGATAVAPVD